MLEKKLSNSYKKNNKFTAPNEITKRKISESLKNKGNLLNTRGKRITNGSIIFNSLKECSNYYNISINKIKKIIDNINNDLNLSYIKKVNEKEVIGPDGTVYSSITKCSRITKHNKSTLRNWIKDFPEKGFKYKEDS